MATVVGSVNISTPQGVVLVVPAVLKDGLIEITSPMTFVPNKEYN